MSAERVLVVPRDVVMGDPGWHGVVAANIDVVQELVRTVGRFVDRSAAEDDRHLKQVIPYLVLRDGDRYFLMRRTRAGADARLHDRWSIGLGGHLNPGDVDLTGGLRREWTEEVNAAFVPEFEFVGLLNDDTTEVGTVHLGAVFTADAADRPVTIRETNKLSGGFAASNAVAAVLERLETWSALAFEFLESRPPVSPT